MHRLHSSCSIIRFRLAAWVLFGLMLLLPITGGLLIYSMLFGAREHLMVCLILLSVLISGTIVQWALSQRACCPLCHTRAIARNGCAKHRGARRLFGSCRLWTACSIILRNSFRCPYCGEPIAIRLRTIRLTHEKRLR